MKVTLKCNHDKSGPDFTANGETVELQYVSPIPHCFVTDGIYIRTYVHIYALFVSTYVRTYVLSHFRVAT